MPRRGELTDELPLTRVNHLLRCEALPDPHINLSCCHRLFGAVKIVHHHKGCVLGNVPALLRSQDVGHEVGAAAHPRDTKHLALQIAKGGNLASSTHVDAQAQRGVHVCTDDLEWRPSRCLRHGTLRNHQGNIDMSSLEVLRHLPSTLWSHLPLEVYTVRFVQATLLRDVEGRKEVLGHACNPQGLQVAPGLHSKCRKLRRGTRGSVAQSSWA
mmetsp:Transcript_8447/g.17524  ORF Transcript_8447/g.17524 Transcript_8447/m.17524 type:complete len:213 (+) Transcript_8447:494-1132(+)